MNQNPWGRTLYVNANSTRGGDTGRSGLDPGNPLATIVQAVANARAGDQIVVRGPHTETIDSAAKLDVNLADLSIIGLGFGHRRPMIRVNTTTAAYVKVSAAGCYMENLRFDGGLDAITKLLEVAADDFVGINLEVSQTTGQPVTAILLTDADRSKILGLKAIQDGAGATRCIDLVGGDDIEIADCSIRGNYSGGNISNSATALTHLAIHHNDLKNEHANERTTGVASPRTRRRRGSPRPTASGTKTTGSTLTVKPASSSARRPRKQPGRPGIWSCWSCKLRRWAGWTTRTVLATRARETFRSSAS
jgi:hypothetical protein